MRVTLKGDGATTAQVRELAATLAAIGHRMALVVGCDGPEKWNFETPPLRPNEFAQISAQLVKCDGVPLADLLG